MKSNDVSVVLSLICHRYEDNRTTGAAHRLLLFIYVFKHLYGAFIIRLYEVKHSNSIATVMSGRFFGRAVKNGQFLIFFRPINCIRPYN